VEWNKGSFVLQNEYQSNSQWSVCYGKKLVSKNPTIS
jgi:hypothetical protein